MIKRRSQTNGLWTVASSTVRHNHLLRLFTLPFQITDNIAHYAGPFLEGCRWNEQEMVLDESRPKELYVPMPCIFFKPVKDRVLPYGPTPWFATKDRKAEEDPNTVIAYVCPMYKTLKRAGLLMTSGHSTNYIMNVEVPSKKPQSWWIKRSVALFCALRD